MRYRSQKNSHKERDELLREEYRKKNFRCELRSLLLQKFGVVCDTGKIDVHHIFGGRKGRCDLTTNLICLSREAHDWCHRNVVDGRVLCMWIKITKGEFDLKEFKIVSGMNAYGWLCWKQGSVSVEASSVFECAKDAIEVWSEVGQQL